MNFSHRSYQKELLDRDDIPFDDIKLNMKELDFINRWLGGHAITISGLKTFVQKHNTVLRICEIGCGGGDNLRVIKRWCEKNNLPATFTGVDINPHCIAFAKARKENAGIEFICSDYRQAEFIHKPSVIFSSLFCHHFTDDEVIQILKWGNENAELGFFINDLHRHRLAYYSIKWLTQLFSKSYMVKNDAPLSVQRGFRRREWINYFQQAGLSSYRVQWRWAFRWLITCTKTSVNT